ncbi:MAG TPA: WecB/TagA/CpsF family glycosyltransferase [Terriglobia bacterium]|nr:WecB/TagA/CpsF family glycosyltransferase [Terriglobia bacterium]
MRTPSFDLFGIRLHALSKIDLVREVSHAVTNHSTSIIGNHNLHSLYLWFQEPRMREFYSFADYIHIDGMSIILLGRLLGLPLRREHRTAYMDLLPILAQEAVKKDWRIFYLGSKPGVAEKAARILRSQHKGLQIATHHGHFDPTQTGTENQSILAEIKAYSPDILMVGMGMPRQEAWVIENRKDIAAHAVFCCGALMDYVAGEIPTPPRWIGLLGFEWLYRLLSEPGRLWRRYLLEPWSVMGQIARLVLSSSNSRTHAGVGPDE